MVQRYSMHLFVSVYQVMTCPDELLGNFLRPRLQDHSYFSLRLFPKKSRLLFRLVSLIRLMLISLSFPSTVFRSCSWTNVTDTFLTIYEIDVLSYMNRLSIPSVALRLRLGPSLPQNTPPFFSVCCSSPPSSYS